MASAQKTDFLSLNKWISTDIPKREDFNYDNTTIDTAFKGHLGDMSKHISETERTKWNAPHYVGFYIGDGTSARTVTTSCPFDPSFAIVFSGNSPAVVSDSNSTLTKVRFGFASKRAGSLGIAFSGRNLAVSYPSADSTAVEMNRLGATYCFILFR